MATPGRFEHAMGSASKAKNAETLQKYLHCKMRKFNLLVYQHHPNQATFQSLPWHCLSRHGEGKMWLAEEKLQPSDLMLAT
jgi:hypothetical protein